MKSLAGTQKEYFQNLYRSSEDSFRNSKYDYEENKRGIALGILSKPVYQSQRSIQAQIGNSVSRLFKK